ncbi:MAG: isochorismate synthase [Candidatus Saccharimonadales bacterium]
MKTDYFASLILPGDSRRLTFKESAGHFVNAEGVSLTLTPFNDRGQTGFARDASVAEHTKVIKKAIRAIKEGKLKKVVLARQTTLKHPQPHSFMGRFEALVVAHPKAFRFLIHSGRHGTWLGASPELLLRKRGTHYTTMALAGTIPAVKIKNWTWTDKERTEQNYVVEDIKKQLRKIGVTDVNVGPVKISKNGPVAHLKSELSFKFKDDPKMLLAALHPTAAMCGFPRKAALSFIEKHETFDRSLYSGYACIEYPNGDIDAFVLIRCMRILKDKIVLFAGGGIIDTSDPAKEWRETELKMQTVLAPLGMAI